MFAVFYAIFEFGEYSVARIGKARFGGLADTPEDSLRLGREITRDRPRSPAEVMPVGAHFEIKVLPVLGRRLPELMGDASDYFNDLHEQWVDGAEQHEFDREAKERLAKRFRERGRKRADQE
jgi:hypothetical protein